MKYIYLFIFAFCFNTIIAQETKSVSISPGYASQTFYNLTSGDATSINPESWDLAFSTNPYGYGISINEGAAYGSDPVSIYLSSETDFSSTIDINTLGDALTNDEKGWEEGTALNAVNDSQNPMDIGWGIYDPVTHAIDGDKIFVLKLRDGNYKKLIITSLNQGTYTIKYADLDGNNEETKTIEKADFPDTNLALFSLSSGSTISIPNDWDLLFTRYNTMVPDGSGGSVPYTVTGVLSGYNVEAIKVSGVNPSEINHDEFYTTYISQLSTDIDAIGYDWKSYTGSWTIPSDVVYFVQDINQDVFKITFVDFEGSSTGVIVFDQEMITNTASLDDKNTSIQSFTISPNPVIDNTSISFESIDSENVDFQLFDITGKMIQQNSIYISNGLNNIELDMSGYAKGQYIFVLNTASGHITQLINKQ